MFETRSEGSGGVVLVPRGDADDAERGPRGPGVVVLTEEQAETVAFEDPAPAIDPGVRAAAREIASHLSIRPPSRESASHRGGGLMQSVPFRGGVDDIDLDRTLEVLAERRVLEDEDIIVRERIQRRRAVVLAVDLSGSMRDERIRTAAATVGALAGEMADDEFAVLGFWSDAAWLSHFGARTAAYRLLDALVSMPTRGLTNISLPLTAAADELSTAHVPDRRVVLLSDCVHNAGPDPRIAASRLPRVDVLLDEMGEKDLELGRQLAHLGNGRLRRISSYRDVAPALGEIFAP